MRALILLALFPLGCAEPGGGATDAGDTVRDEASPIDDSSPADDTSAVDAANVPAAPGDAPPGDALSPGLHIRIVSGDRLAALASVATSGPLVIGVTDEAERAVLPGDHSIVALVGGILRPSFLLHVVP